MIFIFVLCVDVILISDFFHTITWIYFLRFPFLNWVSACLVFLSTTISVDFLFLGWTMPDLSLGLLITLTSDFPVFSFLVLDFGISTISIDFLFLGDWFSDFLLISLTSVFSTVSFLVLDFGPSITSIDFRFLELMLDLLTSLVSRISFLGLDFGISTFSFCVLDFGVSLIFFSVPDLGISCHRHPDTYHASLWPLVYNWRWGCWICLSRAV